METCYTPFAIQYLKNVHVLNIGKGQTRSFGRLGGALAGDINRNLARLRSWLCVTKAVAMVEFPDFEGIAAFHVFSLCTKERAGWIDEELLDDEPQARKTKLRDSGYHVGRGCVQS